MRAYCETYGRTMNHGDTELMLGHLVENSANCSYCSVQFVRGRLHSYSPNLLIEEVKNAVETGHRGILLSAQDTAVYGPDIGTDLPSLLKKNSSIDSKFMVRVGMMNPSFAKRILPELIEACESDKIVKARPTYLIGVPA